MTVLIGSWEFEGPFGNLSELHDEPGLVAILTGKNDEYELIEMEESDSVKSFIDTHNKYNFRVENADEDLLVAVYYCSDLTASLRFGLIEEVMKELDDTGADVEEIELTPANLLHPDFAEVANS